MNKILPLLFILFISTFTLAQEARYDYVPGEMYVMLRENISSDIIKPDGSIATEPFYENFGSLLKKENVKEIVAPFYTAKGALKRVIRIGLNDTSTTRNLIEKLNLDPRCDYAEGVPMAYTDYTPDDLGANALGNQWHLYKIQAQEAWDISKGDKKVAVAIVDDALSINHPDLKNNVWVNPNEIPNNNIDDDLNGFIDDVNGYDVGDADNNPSPINSNFSHGTHVGGIIGATTDNSIGIASIGFNISLMGVKATITGQSTTTSIPRGYEGIFYAGSAGADVINCSWSGPAFSATANLIVQDAITAGSIIVAAMGNDGQNLTRYPAAYSGVISVAATQNNDSRASFSNFATYTSISAPGYQIFSTYTNNSYAAQSGTSMATPLVAGMMGLMKSHYLSLTNEQLIGCMMKNADDISGNNSAFYSDKLGAGRINAYKSLLCVDTLKSSPPSISFAPLENAYCPNNPVQFDAVSLAGEADSFYWEFPGGIPSTSSTPNPLVVYPSVGVYDYKLTLFNSFGQSHKEVQAGVTISHEGIASIFEDGFESGLRPTMWTSVGDDPTRMFEEKELVYSSGDTDRVVWVQGYNGKFGNKSQLISMPLDFSDYKNVRLNFNFAYARRSSGGKDSLFIKFSRDGGMTYETVFSEVMKNLNVSGNFGGFFTPTAKNVWCDAQNSCVEFDLSKADGAKNVIVVIEYHHDVLGGNLYLDDVFVGGNCAKYENIHANEIQIYPNPGNGLFNLSGVKGEGDIDVFDASGKFLISQPLVNGIQSLDLSTYAQGVYIIRWKNQDGNIQSAKVVVAH